MDNEHLSFFGNFSKMQHFKVYSGFTPTLSENTEEYYSKKSKLLHIITCLNLTEKEKTELKNIVKSINGLKISAFMKEMEHTYPHLTAQILGVLRTASGQNQVHAPRSLDASQMPA